MCGCGCGCGWAPADEAGELEGAEGLRLLEDAAGVAEADEELGHAEEEALEVELEEFPVRGRVQLAGRLGGGGALTFQTWSRRSRCGAGWRARS